MKNKIKLYDCFKHWYDNGVVYLYSDPHFSDEEMKYLRTNYVGDEEQVRRINSKVGKYDTIIFLGDIGNVEWIKKVRGYKILIKGNHDGGVGKYKRDRKEDNKLFDEVYDGFLAINDKIILSHQPVQTMPYAFNIHGHVHGLYVPDNHHCNVCAEHIDYTPVRLDDIVVDNKVKDIKNIHRYFTDIAKEEKKSEVLQ